ncbi:MAG: hypothetical protein DMG08_21625, partial [Acidobacteria bacterium]
EGDELPPPEQVEVAVPEGDKTSSWVHQAFLDTPPRRNHTAFTAKAAWKGAGSLAGGERSEPPE